MFNEDFYLPLYLYEWGGKMETNMSLVGGRNMGVAGFFFIFTVWKLFLNIITGRLFEMINRFIKNYHCKRKSLATFCKDIHITRYNLDAARDFQEDLVKWIWKWKVIKIYKLLHKPTPVGFGITMKQQIIPLLSFLRTKPSIFWIFVEKYFYLNITIKIAKNVV